MTPIDAQLLAHADALGVTIEYTAHLPADRDGEYNHRRHLIRLRPGMHGRHHRSVFAHEIAHAVFEDVPSRFGPVTAKQERRAEEWAALQLISLEDYRRVEQIHHGHSGAMALDLDVMISIVRAYQNLLLRLGPTTYVDARMGTGQWSHRIEES